MHQDAGIIACGSRRAAERQPPRRTRARMRNLVRVGMLAVPWLLMLAGCGSAPKSDKPEPEPVTVTPDARLKVEPKSRYGNMKSYVVHGKRYYTKGSSRDHVERGLASWYGRKFHGRKTSSGERYDMHQMTAAHKSLPLPSYVLVTNLENGRSAVVRVNDRGPFVRNRVIDLSRKRKPEYSLQQPVSSQNADTATLETFIAHPDQGPEQESQNRELAIRIRDAVDQLPLEQREVYLMRTEANLAFKEIALAQNVSINTALARMHYALRSLRELLADDYDDLYSQTRKS